MMMRNRKERRLPGIYIVIIRSCRPMAVERISVLEGVLLLAFTATGGEGIQKEGMDSTALAILLLLQDSNLRGILLLRQGLACSWCGESRADRGVGALSTAYGDAALFSITSMNWKRGRRDGGSSDRICECPSTLAESEHDSLARRSILRWGDYYPVFGGVFAVI